MSVFLLPDLGEGLQEAEIVAWHVVAGDHVVADQPLVSVETDKAVVEVPSPRAGQVARLCAEPGARVAVGAPLVEFADAPAEDAGAIVGDLRPAVAPPPTAAARPGTPPSAAVAAMPAARALAARLGLSLEAVRGSGPGGTVTLADVEAAARDGVASTVVRGLEPLRGVRLAMANNMTAARDSVAPATLCDDADVEAWTATTDHSMRLLRAIVAGCRASPDLNAWYDGKAQARRLHSEVALGIAVETEAGLFVPVLREAGSRPPGELRAEFERLKQGIAARSIAPDALRGATFTLSNFGRLGGRYAALCVMSPQVAILGAGRIAAAAAVRDGAVCVRRMLPLSLSFDHRAVTGAEAARFLAAVVADLALPD